MRLNFFVYAKVLALTGPFMFVYGIAYLWPQHRAEAVRIIALLSTLMVIDQGINSVVYRLSATKNRRALNSLIGISIPYAAGSLLLYGGGFLMVLGMFDSNLNARDITGLLVCGVLNCVTNIVTNARLGSADWRGYFHVTASFFLSRMLSLGAFYVLGVRHIDIIYVFLLASLLSAVFASPSKCGEFILASTRMWSRIQNIARFRGFQYKARRKLMIAGGISIFLFNFEKTVLPAMLSRAVAHDLLLVSFFSGAVISVIAASIGHFHYKSIIRYSNGELEFKNSIYKFIGLVLIIFMIGAAGIILIGDAFFMHFYRIEHVEAQALSHNFFVLFAGAMISTLGIIPATMIQAHKRYEYLMYSTLVLAALGICVMILVPVLMGDGFVYWGIFIFNVLSSLIPYTFYKIMRKQKMY